MLEKKISNDYKQAMRDKNAIKVSTLSFLRSQMKYVMIEKKVERLPDEDVIAVIKKQLKQRQDSIEQYQKGGRKDLVDKETQEAEILKTYLPKEMSEEELNSLVAATIQEIQAKGMKDMGTVIKSVLSKVAGKADNKLVSEIVKKQLSAL